jgi:hypothetical protein
LDVGHLTFGTKCPSGDKEYADSEEEIGEDDSELQEGITGF